MLQLLLRLLLREVGGVIAVTVAVAVVVGKVAVDVIGCCWCCCCCEATVRSRHMLPIGSAQPQQLQIGTLARLIHCSACSYISRAGAIGLSPFNTLSALFSFPFSCLVELLLLQWPQMRLPIAIAVDFVAVAVSTASERPRSGSCGRAPTPSS